MIHWRIFAPVTARARTSRVSSVARASCMRVSSRLCSRKKQKAATHRPSSHNTPHRAHHVQRRGNATMELARCRMQYIRRYAQLGMSDVAVVGGKNASLGELYRHLAAEGVKVPNGFATTAAAYRHYLEHNRLDTRIHDALATLD